MTDFSKTDQDLIVKTLTDRGAIRPCPRCGRPDFSLAPGLFSHPLQYKVSSLNLGGQNIPVAVVVCNNCGYLSEHALGTLGLLGKVGK